MALNLNEKYVRVNGISGGKNLLYIDVATYENKQADNYESIKLYSFTPTLKGENFIAQSYDYLKTLPEFADAVDC